jgi:hypothetical protein
MKGIGRRQRFHEQGRWRRNQWLARGNGAGPAGGTGVAPGYGAPVHSGRSSAPPGG